MVLKKSNMKRKYTKRRPNMKRKYTKRKSKKYGGKFINTTSKFINMTKMDELKQYLQKIAGLSLVEANDIVDGMEHSEYIYDCGDVLKQLKTAVSTGRSNGNYDKADIIFNTLNTIDKQAKKSQPPKSISQNLAETQKEVSNDGCPSHGREPVDCSEKKDYLKQTLIFHPDKNPMCREQATPKFQALQNNTSCQFD